MAEEKKDAQEPVKLLKKALKPEGKKVEQG